jgi:hypothetical protein
MKQRLKEQYKEEKSWFFEKINKIGNPSPN